MASHTCIGWALDCWWLELHDNTSEGSDLFGFWTNILFFSPIDQAVPSILPGEA